MYKNLLKKNDFVPQQLITTFYKSSFQIDFGKMI